MNLKQKHSIGLVILVMSLSVGHANQNSLQHLEQYRAKDISQMDAAKGRYFNLAFHPITLTEVTT